MTWINGPYSKKKVPVMNDKSSGLRRLLYGLYIVREAQLPARRRSTIRLMVRGCKRQRQEGPLSECVQLIFSLSERASILSCIGLCHFWRKGVIPSAITRVANEGSLPHLRRSRVSNGSDIDHIISALRTARHRPIGGHGFGPEPRASNSRLGHRES